MNSFMSNFEPLELLVTIVVILVCLPIHEVAHGLAAYAFGDNTAKNAGRLTLDPRAHIDPMGLLAFFFLRIGWAKPVPVNLTGMKNPRMGSLFVSIAGPLSNFIMAFLFIFFAMLSPPYSSLQYVLLSIGISNIWLGLFNLIPVLPLDGGQIVASLLPEKASRRLRGFFYKYQGPITIVLLVTFYLGLHRGPLNFFLEFIYSNFIKFAGFLISLFV